MPQTDHRITVDLISQNAIDDSLVQRFMCATRPDGSKHYVTQVHYMAWPDHGVPSASALN